MFLLVAGAALLQWPVGRLSDRIDRRKLIAGLALFGAAGSHRRRRAAVMARALLIGFAPLMGAGPLLLYSLFIAYTNDHLRASRWSRPAACSP